MLDIKYIAFACYPPRSDTSHDGGLVGLKSNLRASNTLSYFAIATISLFIKEILTRRQRSNGIMIICRFFYL
jgi:hypothetical protein